MHDAQQPVCRIIAGVYPETKHPTWHNSFKLPALHGKTHTQKFIEVRAAVLVLVCQLTPQ